MGISPGGTKQQLTARLVAALDGRPPPDPPLRPGSKKPGSIKPGTGGRQLVGELSLDSVIRPGQRCSQELRRFFTDALGPSFRFDAPMREFIARSLPVDARTSPDVTP